jgi:signal peptidase I
LALVIGMSMRPTFTTGDVLLVNKWAYSRERPERGDIVLARSKSDLLVKRVVGLPGETVEINRGRLYIDGVRMRESHPIEPGLLVIAPGTLLDGKFALVGDDRSLPLPQFIHAIVSKDQIIGKVIGTVRLRSRR